MRPGRVLALATMVLLIAACAPDSGVGDAESPTERVPVSAEEPTEMGGAVEAPPPTSTPVGPQLCGTVTSTISEVVTIEIVAGVVDCAFAEVLLGTYYNDPPSIPEGSGAYLTIDGWECNSSASQEPGRVSTCRTAEDGVIIAIAGEAPDGGWCELIDDLTLDQLFADGALSEAVCATYIDAETSVDQQ